ncbi:hypothetical protein [Parerythrobacter lacustris]|uniref:Lipoprotein n=1 Tax=Parerythrobacter lacustris TaxID=2969984 RepID=A0ABT1XNZ1_9SPHN|nr:hypothetical protein [Parerythrobacter lacustris]MCR2833375.1 hypothetical protein [Parerythrobacter lacustris]
MEHRTLILAVGMLAIGGCTTSATNSFPAPGSYDPLSTTQPIDPGRVAVAREIDKIDREIDGGRDSGALSKREGRNLHRANAALAGAADRMGADGLTADEQRGLQMQAGIINGQVQAAKTTGGPNKPE